MRGGSWDGVHRRGDRRKCQTYAASPAEPGGLPLMLDGRAAVLFISTSWYCLPSQTVCQPRRSRRGSKAPSEGDPPRAATAFLAPGLTAPVIASKVTIALKQVPKPLPFAWSKQPRPQLALVPPHQLIRFVKLPYRLVERTVLSCVSGHSAYRRHSITAHSAILA